MAPMLDLPCPACGGRASTLLADHDELLREVEQLWAFHGRRLQPQTPPRQLVDRIVFSQGPALRLVSCDGCGTVLREPREDPESAARHYAGEQPDERLLASLFAAQSRACRPQARRLTRLLGRTGSGLEVGSYAGAFLAAAGAGEWRFEGVDVNPIAVAFARRRGVAVTTGTIEEVDPARRFDVVAIWNCFEQLDDPSAAAGRAAALLAPGGILALRVPNGAFYRALRRFLAGPLAAPAAALLAVNNMLSFPYRHGFTLHSLELLLRRAGCRPICVVGDVLVPTADRWTRRWATLEERALKGAWRAPARLAPVAAPWVEMYARKQ